MKQARERGHDVQLHLHPQWEGARMDSDQQSWKPDMDQWRIGDLAPDRIRGFLANGKQWLESTIGGNRPGLRISTFSAGGWCIQPSTDVVESLEALGFDID